MSDYLFLMESRLNPEQWQAVLRMQRAAEALSMNLYLVGGAIRDLIGGFPIENLDFVVEGNALKLVRGLTRQEVRVTWQSESLRAAELEFPAGVFASVCMARSETYARTGAPPAIAPATIVGDLKRRDFSINAIGVSLNPHSRGLLLDPTNGLADIEKKEIRTLNNYSFLDEPIRIFRAVRFRIRLRFSFEQRTAVQYQNAKESDMPQRASAEALAQELHQIARERIPAEILKALDKENLLPAWSPRLRGDRVNWQEIARATKASHSLAQVGLRAPTFPLFLYLLTRKLPARDQTQLAKRLNLKKPESEAWRRLEKDAKRLAKELGGKAAATPTKLFQLLAATPADLILLLQLRFPQKKIQSRIKTFLQKYLPLRSRLPEKELKGMGVAPGTTLYRKILDAYFYEVLEGKLRTRSDQMKFLKKRAEGGK
jgi:tRNA nucleotidyltransferase/poly(A) polymerase